MMENYAEQPPYRMKRHSQQLIENAERLLPLRGGGVFHFWVDDFERSGERHAESSGD